MQAIQVLFGEIENAAQSWKCGTNDEAVCVIAWYFIAESLRWSCAVVAVSVTMVLLVRLALYAQAAADSFDYGGRMDVRKRGRNLLRVWMSRHRKLLLVGKLLLQIVPSFASCVFFVVRATRREQEGGLYAAELTVNIIFAVSVACFLKGANCGCVNALRSHPAERKTFAVIGSRYSKAQPLSLATARFCVCRCSFFFDLLLIPVHGQFFRQKPSSTF